MKKRVLASLLSLCLLIGSLPTAALATEVETGGEPSPACICTALCTEEEVNMDCPVCVEGYALCAYEGPADEEVLQESVEESGVPVMELTPAEPEEEETTAADGLEADSALLAEDGMSGSCGATEDDNVIWALTKNEDGESTYTLTISGNGAMADYAKNSTAATDDMPVYTSAPWRTASVVKTESVLPDNTTYGGTYYSGITRIVIENGVTRIGSSAFSYMKDVKEISIADSVTSIGDRAFMFNYSLESIAIPDSVVMDTLYESNKDGDGELLLGHCYSLKHVALGNGFSVIPCRAFEGTNIKLDQIDMDQSKIIGIGTQAFFNKTISVEELDLTSFSSLKDLKNNTFSFWTIERVKFPASLEKLGSFNTVTGLSEVNWTDLTSLKEIAANAFKETEIEAADLSNTQIMTIGWAAFESCDSLAAVVLPDTVTTIHDRAFIGLPAGSTITVPEDKYTLLTGKYTPENTSIITVGTSDPEEDKIIGLTHNETTTFFSSLASAANNAVSGDTIFATSAYTFGANEVAVVRAGVTLEEENLSGYGATFANDERTAYCGTLQAALESCDDGDTVTLNRDVTVSANMIVNKDISIDLNEKTVTSTEFPAPFFVKSNVNCTIANGTIANTCKDYGICVDTDNGSNTILSNLMITNTDKKGTTPSSVRVRSCTLVLSGVNMNGQQLYTVDTEGQNEPTVFFAGSNTMGSTLIGGPAGTWSLYFDSNNSNILTNDKDNAIIYRLGCDYADLSSTNPILRESYTFGGWYENEDFVDEAVTTPQAGKTYYAKWVTEITFDANGGEGIMADQQVTEGDETTTLFVNGFTKTGYSFNGWNTAADGTGTPYAADAMAFTVPNGTTLYAQWTANTYTIKFDGGAGSSGTMADVTATYDTAVELPANGFTMPGKKFAGWDTDSSADEVVYSDESDVVENLTTEPNVIVTLYAVWTDKQVLDPDLTDTVVTYNGQPQKFHVDSSYTVTYYQNREKVTPTDAGIYDVELTRAEDETYAAYHGRVMGGLVIEKAPLTVKADDQSIQVGNELPQFTYTVSGWQGDDTDDLLSDVSIVCDGANPDKAGEYVITVTGPQELDNYKVSYENGTLTVSKRSSGGAHHPDASDNSGSKRYDISKPSDVENGSIKVSDSKAEKGETVTITVTPDEGYELDELTVTDEDGDEIDLKDKGDGKFTFEMPKSDVEIEVSFKLIGTGSENPFADVAKSDYFYDAVLWAVDEGITSGMTDTSFAPNISCTRAQMVTFLWRANGSPVVDYAMNFTDVPADAYYAEAVRWAVSKGITSGISETSFAPDMTVTRVQTVTFLHRAAGAPAVSGGSFADVDANAYYANAVAWAVSENITSGTSASTFSPDAPCTRAQIVTFLYRDAQ